MAATLISRAAHAQEDASQRSSLDEVVLRDGTSLRGRVIQQEPGKFVVIQTEDGRKRTLHWEAVTEVNVPSQEPNESSPPILPSPSFRERSGHRLTYELKANVVGMISARRTYAASGHCATGTALVPVSIYGQTGSARLVGTGIGLGVGGGYMYLAPPDPNSRFPFWALRAGAGLFLDYLYVEMPTGIDETSGELCATVQRRSPHVKRESGSMLLLRVPLQFGAHIGIGSFRDSLTWQGILVGAAFAPSLTHLEPSVGSRSTEVRWLGTEMTVDFVSLHAAPSAGAYPAHWRIAAFISPPSRRLEPLIVTLSLGAVWY